MIILNKKISTWLILWLSLTGCNMVESTNKVMYEDQTPVIEAKVHQFNDTVDYITYTNVLGEWSLTLPVGSEWELCIHDGSFEACYQGTLTVSPDGELLR